MRSVSENNIKLYIGIPLEGVPLLFFIPTLLDEKKDIKPNLWNLFRGTEGETSFSYIQIVTNPAEADFFLLPHNYFALEKIKGRLAEEHTDTYVRLAEKHNKKIIIFAMADTDRFVNVPRSYIFRYSQYGYKQRDNEIIIPPYTTYSAFYSKEGMEYRRNRAREFVPRTKSEKPIVGFCGWADFPSFFRFLTYRAHVLIFDLKKYLLRDRHAPLHKHGIYWRRKAVHALLGVKKLNMQFILRKSYAAQKGIDGTREIQSFKAEREYIDNIVSSDLVLAPKGHGNASIRFYEILSLGRIPVLVNTDCPLPLSGLIDYDKFIVNVPSTRIQELEQKILDFYNSLNSEEFIQRQKMARAAFELLRPGSFLKIVLSKLKQEKQGYRT